MSKITIEEADNGYIVDLGIDDETGLHARSVFSCEKDYEEEKDEVETLIRMLNFVSRELRSYNKFSEYNANVVMEAGYKVNEDENFPPCVPPRYYTSKL